MGESIFRRVHFIYPPTPKRSLALEYIKRRENCPQRYLLYGYDAFLNAGFEVSHNLKPLKKVARYIGHYYRKIIVGLGGYSGDIEWLVNCFWDYWRSSHVVAVSDRAIIPILYLRFLRILRKKPTVYIAIGLPEKLGEFKNKYLLKVVIHELRKLKRIVTLSKIEAKELSQKWGLYENVTFLPAGADQEWFRPARNQSNIESIDVLSIGADPYRDFKTLFNAADYLQDFSFLVVASQAHAANFESLPPNVKVKIDVDMEELGPLMASSTIIALPVHENSYSGGTTVMLQAMASGKTVVANNVGANKEGYGFKDKENCLLIDSGSAQVLANTLNVLLKDKKDKRRIADNARRHVERFLTLDNFHKQLIDITLE